MLLFSHTPKSIFCVNISYFKQARLIRNMSSVLNGSGMQQNTNIMMRNQVFGLKAQIKDLNETVAKLTDIVREIAIKTDVSMELLDAGNTRAASSVSIPTPVVSAAPVYSQPAPPTTLSGNLRRR
jgi:hypothetical protein